MSEPVQFPERPTDDDPTTSELSEMVSRGDEPARPVDLEPVTDSGEESPRP
jgi:hypothetical protein